MDTKTKDKTDKLTTVQISDTLRTDLKIRAAQEGTSQKNLLNKIVKDYLKPTNGSSKQKQ